MRHKVSWVIILMVGALLLAGNASAQQQAAPPKSATTRLLVEKAPLAPTAGVYFERERSAPPKLRSQLAEMRKTIKAKKYTFQVGYTRAMDRPPSSLTGDIVPANALAIARSYNQLARKLIQIDNDTLQTYKRSRPAGAAVDLNIPCQATARSFISASTQS